MIAERYKTKVPCTRCGTPCHRLCYVRERVVCVDCFHTACYEAAKQRGDEVDQEREG